MANLTNQVVFEGNSTFSAVMENKGGHNYTRICIMQNEKYTGKDGTPKERKAAIYFDCWGYVAQQAAGIKTGDKVLVLASLETDNYEVTDESTGELKQRSATKFRAEKVYKLTNQNESLRGAVNALKQVVAGGNASTLLDNYEAQLFAREVNELNSVGK